MTEGIKVLILKFKRGIENKHYSKIDKLNFVHKRTLLDYTIFQAHLSKSDIKRMIETDTDIPKKTIKAIIKLGSKKVRKFLMDET